MTRAALMAALHDTIKPGARSHVLAKWDDYPLDLGYWRARVYYEVSRDYFQHEIRGGGVAHMGDVALARVLMVCFNHFRLKGDLPDDLTFPATFLLSQEAKIEALNRFADKVEALP